MTADSAASRRHDLAGYAFAALGACLFASKGVIIKLVYQAGVSTETLLALRLGLALPVYLAIGAGSLIKGRTLPEPRLMGLAALVGALGYWFASYADFLGLEYISVQFERLILFTYPAFVVLFGALIFGQRIRPRALIGIAISYAGLILMFGVKLHVLGHAVVKGALLVLSAAIAFAFYQLLAKGLVARLGARLFTCIAMIGATAATFVQFAATQPASNLIVGPHVFGYALLLTFAATIAPTFLLNAALERISPQANGAIGTLSPVVTLVLAVIVLHETIGWVDIAATVVVLAGVGWFTLLEGRPSPRPALGAR